MSNRLLHLGRYVQHCERCLSFASALGERLDQELRSTHSCQTGKLTDAILKSQIQVIIRHPPFCGSVNQGNPHPFEISAHKKTDWLQEEFSREIRDGKIVIRKKRTQPFDLQIKRRGHLLLNAESELRAGNKARFPDFKKLIGSLEVSELSIFVWSSSSDRQNEKTFIDPWSRSRVRSEPFLYCAIQRSKNKMIDSARARLWLTCGTNLFCDLPLSDRGFIDTPLTVLDPFCGSGTLARAKPALPARFDPATRDTLAMKKLTRRKKKHTSAM